MNYLNIFLLVLAYFAIGVCVMLLTMKAIRRDVKREKQSVIVALVVCWVLFIALVILIFVKEVFARALRTAYEEIFM